jgi:hypothetical protein
LKGRTFRCAVQALYFCHSEWASAHEESALATFSAACSVVPNGIALLQDFSPCMQRQGLKPKSLKNSYGTSKDVP